jgi:GT2 family glycosyltransferase/predicted SAM-dependent methyltransferase
VSIILLHYTKDELVDACLASLLRYGARCSFEVIVVANGSPKENVDRLQVWRPNIRILRLEQNLSFSAANNIGARTARGKYLLLLNDDTTVTAGWLDEMVAHLESDPRIGIVGPKLLYPDNQRIQHCGTVFNERGFGEHIYRTLSGDFAAANRPRFYRALTGACLLNERNLFIRVGGFDENFSKTGGCEDTDLCFKLLDEGKVPSYCPSSVVYHHEGLTRGLRDEDDAEDSQNRRLLHQRWTKYMLPDISDYCLLAEIEAAEGKSWLWLKDVPADIRKRHDTTTRRAVGRFPFRIQIGFGAEPEMGYVQVAPPGSAPRIDIAYDPAAPLPFVDASVGEILAKRLLEYLPWPALPDVLRELHRVLTSGGRLVIRTPDLRLVFDDCYSATNRSARSAHTDPPSDSDRSALMMRVNRLLFGDQRDSEIHRSCVDGESLIALCRAVGFSEVHYSPVDDRADMGCAAEVVALR